MQVGKAGLWPWLFQRITAIFLVIGLVVHFYVLHFVIEGDITFEKVASRLSSPWWITFDLLLLAAVIYHGLNGVWGIILDYNPRVTARKWIGW
ncbi:MAG: succinate dehydrogenase, hydrophobic membrane anchor protein, partial [Fidelibacterota bacterium]